MDEPWMRRSRAPCEDCPAQACVFVTALQGRDAACDVVRTTARVKARQTLFHEGLPASTVWLLVRGHVKLSMAGPRGTTRVVDLVSGERTPGAVLDPLGLGLGLHALTGETLSDAQVCGISRADAIRILSEEPGLAVRLLTELSQWMAGLVRSVGHDLGGRVRERLARTLLDVGERHGVRTREGITVPLELYRQEWADLVGTSRETVVRLLTGFCREGLISVQGRRMTLRDPDRLARLARSDGHHQPT